jgi:hypothetical protein
VNFLLIEALAEFEPFLKNICQRHKAQFVLAVAGEASLPDVQSRPAACVVGQRNQPIWPLVLQRSR